eukprot:COSAG01_NODE_33162_length_560_cov_0.693617_1_plen_34_part_01
MQLANVDSIINPSEPSASRREQPARQGFPRGLYW